MQTQIYRLVCPIDKEIKYIGKTTQPLSVRLDSHISYARKKSHLKGKHEWIRTLYNLGLKPIIEWIETCEGDIWVEREKYWVSFYSKNFILYNKTKGGEDFIFKQGNEPWNKGGGKYSPEHIERMSLAKKGKPLNPEHAENVRKSNKKRYEAGELSKMWENPRKGAEIHNARKCLEYNLEGNFIKEWECISDAERANDSADINQCCREVIKTAKGKIWRYWTENYPLKIEVDLDMSMNKVEVYDLNWNLLQTFKNTLKAAEWIKFNAIKWKPKNLHTVRGAIRNAIKKNKKYRGFYWKFIQKELNPVYLKTIKKETK